VALIEKESFFTLPQTLSATTYDHFAGISVKVTMGGRTREVSFDAPNDTHNAAALRRFWAVWRGILKAVPSPNKNEEMLFWIRYEHPELAERSNQSLQLTAGRSQASRKIMKALPLQSTLALASGS
jgi:hypothetical protein